MDNYIKFLFIINSRLAKWGSFEDFIIGMAKYFKETLGEECGFVFPKAMTKAVVDELGRWAEVFVLNKPFDSAEAITEIKDIARGFAPGLVNLHFCDFGRIGGLLSWFKRRGIKTVYHYHGEILPLSEMAWWKRYVSSIRIFTWFADKIITVSEANKRFLEFLNVRPPIEVVYNGISVGRFEGHKPDCGFLDRYGIREGEDYICYLGTLGGRKRTDVLLEIFAEVLKRYDKNLKLLVMGKGDVGFYRNKAEKLGVADNVVFSGLVEEYPYGAIAGAKVFVSASRQESFGLVFAESLLLGAPVVAFRVGGIPEVVIDGKSGFLVDDGDKAGFAERVLALLEDEALRKGCVEFGRRYIVDNFSMERIIEQLAGEFEKVIAGG